MGRGNLLVQKVEGQRWVLQESEMESICFEGQKVQLMTSKDRFKHEARGDDAACLQDCKLANDVVWFIL